MEPSLAATLADLSGTDPDANVAAIKTAVANYLSQADPSLRIRTTEYFNHTFSPDIVLYWADESAGSRSVFIRADAREKSLLEDLSWVPASDPLLFPLLDVVGELGPGAQDLAHREELSSEAIAKGAIIASPASLEQLQAAGPDSRVTKLFSRAVVRGGRGLLDAQRARAASETVFRGYEGAQETESSPTQAAIESIEQLVRLDEAIQLTRFFQALWIGGGGSEASFPGATGVRGPITADSLQLLLDLEDVGDDDFWARVARSLNLERIVSLTVAPESERFQRLVEGSLVRLRGRAFGVFADTNPLLKEGEFRWYAREGYLGLQGQNFRAAFTPTSASSLEVAGQIAPSDGLSIRTLLDRVDEHSLRFSELSLDSGTGTRLTLTLGEPGNAANDALLAELTEPLENNATVVSIVIVLDDGREVLCDLERGRAKGRTGAKYFFSEMLESALPVLHRLTPDEQAAIDSLLALTSRPEASSEPE